LFADCTEAWLDFPLLAPCLETVAVELLCFVSHKMEETSRAHPTGRIPRVTRLMALAIHLEHLVGSGQVEDYATLASLGHVTRARITQIINLTLLAPDVQEALLFLPRVHRGPDPITERDLRPIVAQPDWQRQRQMWRQLTAIFENRRSV
jgi:hypothetical protein